ncbi:alpha/beta fold hydrolase [Alkalicoccus urumqiensis]|uniref:Alpha/beta hydrolase n=1 Tax=Alkalicoccus urumqiensis TaxID=1548213 RepID=A0A2P6MJ12_ALKUR|nr:alpha/beta hydrolase [Alkalicoccus urumqiensis]PRO66278.1 alpha/beta hydrolase [Alkalicoccus urumqiensis]
MAPYTFKQRNNAQIEGGGGQKLVLAHGFGTDQQVWFQIVPELASSFEIMTFDYTGAGHSRLDAYDEKRYAELEGYADDIIELLDEAGWDNVFFVGHSISSMIGAEAAIKRPDLFSHLVMISPSAHYLNDGDYRGGFDEQEIDELMTFMERNYREWSKTIGTVAAGNEDRPEVAEDFIGRLRRNDETITRQFANVTFRIDMRERVKELTVPASILQTSEDTIAPVDAGKYLEEVIPDASMHIMEANGHNPHLSDPEETIKWIRKLLLKDSMEE